MARLVPIWMLWRLGLLIPSLFALLLAVLLYSSEFEAPFHRGVLPPIDDLIDVDGNFERRTFHFACSSLSCEAFVYLPRRPKDEKPPVIVMGHGMGAQKDFELDKRVAPRFAKEGYAVFLFDYRNFGGSDGEPRNWVSPTRHLEDWRSAIESVNASFADVVDTERLILWGTSFSGAHVLVLGATLSEPWRSRVRAIIAQVPHLDSTVAARKTAIRTRVKLGVLALRDIFCQKTGWCKRVYFKLLCVPPEPCMLKVHKEMYEHLLDRRSTARGGWRNKVPARIALDVIRYNPIHFVDKIQAPVLYQAGGMDTLCPPDVVRRAAEKTPNGEYWVGESLYHHDFYFDGLEEAIAAQLEFLRKRF